MNGIALAGLLVAAPVAAQEVEVTASPLADGVTLYRGHPNGNVLAVRTAEGLVLVDAQSAGPAADLARLLPDLPVRLVISTHYHEDHIGGNPRFRAAGAELLAHAGLVPLARRDTTIPETGWEFAAAPRDALPTVTVAGDTAFGEAETRMEVWHAPAAHTAGDLMVWLPEARVFHTGDVYEVEAYPFIDVWAGGSIDGMIHAIRRVLERVPGDATIVPGHGPPTTVAALAAYRDMLVQVRAAVSERIAAGASVEEMLDAGLSAPYDAARGGARAGRTFVWLVHESLVRDTGEP